MNRIQSASEMNAPGKARAVREMFAEIAPSYDRLNHLLSASIDKRWRRLAVRSLEDVLAPEDAIALDLCCGTGDLTIELANKARVVGCDFCHPMLAIGRRKIISHNSTHSCHPRRSRRIAASLWRRPIQRSNRCIRSAQSWSRSGRTR